MSKPRQEPCTYWKWHNPSQLTCLGLMLAFLGAVLTLTAAAQTTTFPTREIRIVVPYGPGGASDQAARKIAEIVAVRGWLNQPIIVSNLPEAGTRDGLRAVQSARPDGHTLLLHHNAFITAEILGQLPESLYWHIGFRPIAGMLESPMTITVLPNSPWQTFEELLSDIAARPGEISVGFPGINVPSYLGFHSVLLSAAEQRGQPLEIHDVFYQGGAATKAAHLGGQVDVVPAWTMDSVPEARAGHFRILAVGNEERLSELPDVPTIKETGVPVAEGSAGLSLRLSVWAPRETPDEVVEQLETLLRQVYETEEWRAFAQSVAAVPMFRTGAELERVFELDTEIMRVTAEAVLTQ